MRGFTTQGVASALVALALSLVGCGGGGGSSGGGGGASNVTVSGAISAGSFVAASVGAKAHPIGRAVSLTNLEIYVIYTSSGTVGITQAAVDAGTGAWSFQVPANSQINAIVRNSVSLELVGPITFIDPTQTDLLPGARHSLQFYAA